MNWNYKPKVHECFTRTNIWLQRHIDYKTNYVSRTINLHITRGLWHHNWIQPLHDWLETCNSFNFAPGISNIRILPLTGIISMELNEMYGREYIVTFQLVEIVTVEKPGWKYQFYLGISSCCSFFGFDTNFIWGLCILCGVMSIHMRKFQ